MVAASGSLTPPPPPPPGVGLLPVGLAEICGGRQAANSTIAATTTRVKVNIREKGFMRMASVANSRRPKDARQNRLNLHINAPLYSERKLGANRCTECATLQRKASPEYRKSRVS